MRSGCIDKRGRGAAKGFAASIVVLILVSNVAMAQNNGIASPSLSSAGWSSRHISANEITVTGIVQEADPARIAGSPAGIHILLNSPAGHYDVSLGAFLSKGTRQALVNGQQVQVVGVVETRNGNSYLMARQLSVSGRQVPIRSSHGFWCIPATVIPHNKTRPLSAEVPSEASQTHLSSSPRVRNGLAYRVQQW